MLSSGAVAAVGSTQGIAASWQQCWHQTLLKPPALTLSHPYVSPECFFPIQGRIGLEALPYGALALRSLSAQPQASGSKTPVPHNEGNCPVWYEQTDSNRDVADILSREWHSIECMAWTPGFPSSFQDKSGRHWIGWRITFKLPVSLNKTVL